MIWYCTNIIRWYGVVEIWLCKNQKMHLLKLRSVWCSFHKPFIFTKFSNHRAERHFSSPFYFCRNNLFHHPQINALLVLWQELPLFKALSFRLLTVQWLFINLKFLSLYFCNFISSSLSSSKFSLVFNMYSSYISPRTSSGVVHFSLLGQVTYT